MNTPQALQIRKNRTSTKRLIGTSFAMNRLVGIRPGSQIQRNIGVKASSAVKMNH